MRLVWLSTSGIPERRTPGCWNNVGMCCGDAGVADLLIALHRIDAEAGHAALTSRLLENVLVQSEKTTTGRRWSFAEHRVRPAELTTQTGLMQGAAGAAT